MVGLKTHAKILPKVVTPRDLEGKHRRKRRRMMNPRDLVVNAEEEL